MRRAPRRCAERTLLALQRHAANRGTLPMLDMSNANHGGVGAPHGAFAPPSGAPQGDPFGSHLGTTGNQAKIRRKRKPQNPWSRAERQRRDAIRSVIAQGEERVGGAKRSEALRQCESASVLMDPGGEGRPRAPALSLSTGRPVARVRHCDHRLCPTCARARSAEHARELTDAVAKTFKRRPVLLTLTQRDMPGESVGEACDRILAAWSRLRKSSEWREHVDGGWRSIEVTWNRKTGAVHAHIHAVIDVEWWAQVELLASWRTAIDVDDDKSGGARIERLRAGIKEAVKYTAKPGDVMHWPSSRLDELLRWMRGRRLLQTFGHLYGTKLRETETETDGAEEGDKEVANGATGEVVRAADCQWSSRGDDVEAFRRYAAAEWELAHPWAQSRGGTADCDVMRH